MRFSAPELVRSETLPRPFGIPHGHHLYRQRRVRCSHAVGDLLLLSIRWSAWSASQIDPQFIWQGLTPPPVSQVAIDERVPLLRTENINAEALQPADLMVVIAFGQKIASRIIDHPRLGSINLRIAIAPLSRAAKAD